MKSRLLLVLLMLPLGIASSPASAAVFTVANTADAGDGSLRWAIQQANSLPGADRIVFNIPGGGVQTIQPLTPLSSISSTVAIDARTQPATCPSRPSRARRVWCSMGLSPSADSRSAWTSSLPPPTPAFADWRS